MKSRQGGWVALVVYGVMAIAAAGVIVAAYDRVQHWCNAACVDLTTERDSARVKAKSSLEALDQAKQANESCRVSVTRAEATIAAQNSAVDQIAAISDEATKRAKTALLAARSAESNAATARLTILATGPPTMGDFNDQCKVADAVLSDLARDRRMRDAGTAAKTVD